MQALFSDPEDQDHRVLVTARWNGDTVDVSAEDDEWRAVVVRAFRPSPVITDDASHRRQGTSGAVQIAPGTLAWFRAVALERAPAETGLAVRLVPGLTEGGFDPAAGYRPFAEQMERLDETVRDRG
ncbi:MAG: hypothetical protein WD096_03235 [Actinomycetota bacterium]